MNWEKYKHRSWFSLGNRKRLKFLYVDTQSHYTSHIDEACKWRLDDWGRTASPSCASFYAQRRTRNASNWWQSARDEAATWIVYVTSVSVWFQSKRKTEERDFRFWQREKCNEIQKTPLSFTCAIFRAVFDSCSSFFSPKPHGNARYAGYDMSFSGLSMSYFRLKMLNEICLFLALNLPIKKSPCSSSQLNVLI